MLVVDFSISYEGLLVSRLDFSIAAPVISALIIGLLQPIFLLILARVPRLARHNARQFIVSSIVTFSLWLSFIVLSDSAMAADDILVGAMILISAEIFYLEIWALLSRGYTIGLVLTLLASERPLTSAELASRYRDGDSLSWIMQHRLGGLIGAGLVSRGAENVTLTPTGSIIAWIYKVCITVLGLRRTG
jgi:hypothetical protein